MAQFDPLIIGPLIWFLTLTLFFYYKISIVILIPNFSLTMKFKKKKLNLSIFFELLKNISEIIDDKSYNILINVKI